MMEDLGRLENDFEEKFAKVLDYFTKETEVFDDVDGRPVHPVVVGIRGVMFARKTGYLLLLANKLASMGYNVLLLTPSVDTRDLAQSQIILSEMIEIRSNYQKDDINGWMLNENLRWGDTYNISTIDDSGVHDRQVEPRMSINRNGITCLSLSVKHLDDFFFERILRPQSVDESEGCEYLLKTHFGCTNENKSDAKFVPNVILFDELQFVSKSNVRDIARIAYKKYRTHIVVASLISDSEQKPFGYYKNIAHLMPLEVKLDRLCHKCSERNAAFTMSYEPQQFQDNTNEEDDLASSDFNTNRIRLGSDTYYVICNECYHEVK